MFENRRNTSFLGNFIISLLTSLGVGLLLLYFGMSYFSSPQQPSKAAPSADQTQIPAPQQLAVEVPGNIPSNITGVAKSSIPGVVGISVLKVDSKSIFDRTPSEKWGVGSGIIATSNGYIITNNHVAGGANKRIIVSLSNGKSVDGVTVWSDPVMDLAVVKVELNDLSSIPLGDSGTLQVGEPAIAIGNPLGLQFQRTVTSGIISALNRTIKIDTEQGVNFMEDLIQTDASINPGNSGGPLLNSKGQVVGINTIKVTSAEAMGFAIPINAVIPVIRQFSEKGSFTEPYLGVFAYDREVMPYIDGNFNFDKGIYVANIDEAGPAYEAGIRVGGVITQIDGRDIHTMMDLRSLIYSKRPGDVLNVSYILDGNTAVSQIKLAAKEKDGLLTR